jgi:hypothetical protein
MLRYVKVLLRAALVLTGLGLGEGVRGREGVCLVSGHFQS